MGSTLVSDFSPFAELSMSKLIVLMPEHLTRTVSSLRAANPKEDSILLVEPTQDWSKENHHKKKIIFLLSSMRHFAADLVEEGFIVEYLKIEDKKNSGILELELEQAVQRIGCERVVITKPGDYKNLLRLRQLSGRLGVEIEILEDDRFLCDERAFNSFAKDKNNLRMEFFYRGMRKKLGILMESGKPVGGKWNLDSENRKFPRAGIENIPRIRHEQDQITKDVVRLVKKTFAKNFGDADGFNFAVTRTEAVAVLEHFIQNCLPSFGDYQDAMLAGENEMFHSQIGLYLNNGLLTPLECIEMAEDSFNAGVAPLNSVEGFIRQILGWREFVRGVYWIKMPDYAEANFFECDRSLPQFFWDGNTDMNCLKQCISETKRHAYAHHIQRLMVLGNFLLLSGVSPIDVNSWFLGVYADAHEWVELPNVTGMALFADGGYLASKPYAAGGAYINKMSDYCKSCAYNVKEKVGEDACPFNYLYWDFISRNREKISANQRMSMIFRTYDKMTDVRKAEISRDSQVFLDRMA